MVAPTVLASPSAGMSYYLEDEATNTHWDRFIVDIFLPHLRATGSVRAARDATVIAGMSMGGYGALKVAFAYPEQFLAVAAMKACLIRGSPIIRLARAIVCTTPPAGRPA